MTTTVPLSDLAAAMRASNSLLLDMLAETAFGEDLLDRIIVIAIARSNTDGIAANQNLQRQYGSLDALPPDELRRPVTISAVASLICVPFETVRRRIQQLAVDGVCEIKPDGVWLPSRIVGTPENDRALRTTYELTLELYNRLKANGYASALPAAGNVVPFDGSPLVRAVSRMAYGHFLRMIAALVRAIGDHTTALILLATLRENSEHTATLPSTVIGPGLMPDELKVPVNAATIAEVLGLGESTVSRRLTRLVRDGRCIKKKGGVIVASAYVARPEIITLLEYNHTSLLRLFEPLQQLGVLAAWDRLEADATV